MVTFWQTSCDSCPGTDDYLFAINIPTTPPLYCVHVRVPRPRRPTNSPGQAFNKYKNKLTESQSVSNRQPLEEAFAKLLADVQRNLESTNRDKFTQRLTSFRISVRQFLTM